MGEVMTSEEKGERSTGETQGMRESQPSSGNKANWYSLNTDDVPGIEQDTFMCIFFLNQVEKAPVWERGQKQSPANVSTPVTQMWKDKNVESTDPHIFDVLVT